ncbi:MAG: histidinol dehydrogenase [Gammaproteobacteria bacterium]|nr:histidinol dehydrogenase [Gammaproteobacteria bacterium]
MQLINWNTLGPAARRAALLRPAMRDRASLNAAVQQIIDRVRRDGDDALRGLTRELDGADPGELLVGEAEFAAAHAALPADAHAAIRVAIDNVRQFHAAQQMADIRVETTAGVVCERVTRPLSAVGLYVPAGSAPLPSTAIMLAVPAALAGCPVRILCTPPRRDGTADPAVLVAARACGIRQVFKVGGAQAVAAMAYGTATVPRVAKIFGPGNSWVTAAKTLVALDPAGAALDMPAGPSEVMVMADDSADARFVALDLLSQAEHGPDSQVVLVCTDPAIAAATAKQIEGVLPALPRRDIIGAALGHSLAIIVDDLDEATAVANEYAPEHLIIQVREPRRLVDRIATAGSVFIGPWTPESVGDYCSGTNHVLPTYGYARAYSGLSVADFQRRMTLQELTVSGLRALAPTVTTLARLEGLDAHAEAVRIRLDATAGDTP